MNPHFLFNSLNSIKHFIIKNKKKEASYFLSKLSKLLRLILDNSRLQEITLQEELDIMKLYLEVENIRLKKEIEFDVTLNDTVEPSRIRIPPLVLQPFIENAIWHGLVLKQGVKRISIRIEKEPSFIQLSIIDNGIGRKTALKNKAARLVEKESLGIDLSRERIEAYVKHLKNDFSIEFRDLQNEEPTGTKVIIRIPLQ
jgi:sensor histidine kinase YesM